MKKIKSMLTLSALAVIAGTGFGCLVSEEHHGRRVYDPAGSPRDYRYERDSRYYHGGRDYQDYDGRYYDDRYDSRHQ